MVARRWTRQDEFRDLIESAARLRGVPIAMAYATIAQESAFNPAAKRVEPQINDASWGLMQILGSTARGYGFRGSEAQLLDPATNLNFGMQALAGALRQAKGNLANAASGYNGGFRPQYGFGSPATATVSICAERNAQGSCIRYRTVQKGQYGNPEYVAGVLEKATYFAQYLEARDGIPVAGPGPGGGPIGIPESSSASTKLIAAAFGAAATIAAVRWLINQLR